MSVMTPFEVAAQLRAAEIRHRWTERNPPPPLHLPAKERRRAWADYRARWAESWEFGECCEAWDARETAQDRDLSPRRLGRDNVTGGG